MKTKNSFFYNLKKTLTKEIGFSKAKTAFFENLALMISSGVNIEKAFETLQKETTDLAFKDNIEYIKTEILNGNPFWLTLKNEKIIPDHIVSIVRIGEESGTLSKNLLMASEQMKKDNEFVSRIRSASIYPIIIFTLLIIISAGIAVFILPRFSQIYKSFNTELPVITQIFVSLGDFFQNYGLIVVPLFLVIMGILIFVLFFNQKTKHIGQTILLGIPGIKQIIQEIEFARFGYIMGNLLEIGVPADKALNIIAKTTSYRAFRDVYKHLEEEITKGFTFNDAFSTYPKIHKWVNESIIELISTGEQTGNLSEIFIKIFDIYSKKNELSSKNISTLFEPILLIIVWVGVAFMAISVIMPIYNIVGNLNDLTGSNSSTITQTDNQVSVTVTIKTDNILNLNSKKIKINTTDTGYVNVRDSIGGKLIAKIKSGEFYDFLEKNAGWYKIAIKDKTGWVNATNVTEIP